ncbi:MAG: response regulator transcription factor [Hyphomicrobium sp.]
MNPDDRPPLTKREIECLQLLALGQSNIGIADNLGIKSPTVAMHLANCRSKLGAVSREHAVAIGISRGIISV